MFNGFIIKYIYPANNLASPIQKVAFKLASPRIRRPNTGRQIIWWCHLSPYSTSCHWTKNRRKPETRPGDWKRILKSSARFRSGRGALLMLVYWADVYLGHSRSEARGIDYRKCDVANSRSRHHRIASSFVWILSASIPFNLSSIHSFFRQPLYCSVWFYL